MKSILPILVAGLALAPAAAQAQDPNPNEVYVQSISYGGTGCPAGSVGSSFSADRKTFTLIFDQFVASIGPGVPITENRKNCQINVNLHLPQGFSYSVATHDYRGYVQLPSGVQAEQKATYFFQGQSQQANAGSRFSGPVSKDYVVRDTLGLPALVWMPCGRTVPLSINSQVRLTGPSTQQAQITTDSVDGKVRHIFGLQFFPCGEAE